MTKTIGGRERKCGFNFRDEKKYNENFPGDVGHGRIRDRFYSLPEVFQPHRNICWEPIMEVQQKTVPVRRHSWSSGINSCGISERLSNGPCNINRKSSQESRKSSSASIPEIIEECSSDDEQLAEENYQNSLNSGLRCRNCFQLDATVKTSIFDKNLYCKTCTELLNTKNYPFIPHFNIHYKRRSSLDPSTSPPRRTRKTSLPESMDLPSIVEPSYDEETNDTKEMQLIVEKEVHRLLSFKKGTHRRNSDNDITLITDFKNLMRKSNIDLIR